MPMKRGGSKGHIVTPVSMPSGGGKKKRSMKGSKRKMR